MTDTTTHAHTNHLIQETSPYLLQHAHNPVDWYPWGEAALRRAKELDRPIFLSIGYSACHWCHVMERESFEDVRIAKVLNEHFVCIKVDREERPDLDELYMRFVQALTGSGGWPMSVWLTPDLQPFFGGTYFPPDRRHGRPAFPEVLEWLHRTWTTDRAKLLEQGERLVEHFRQQEARSYVGDVEPSALDASLDQLWRNFDATWGGFGGAPKFPHAMDIRIALRHHARTQDPRALEMVETSLERMAWGGIYDQLGGGFARYSTDERWLIPHFEKMLYDNALLVPAYLEAYLVTRKPLFAEIARESCEWVLREMVTTEGGFASTLDADSEGEEGRYYVWTPDELDAVLGAELGRQAQEWFDVSDAGNFEHGKNALWRPQPAEVVARKLRVEPAALEAAMERAERLLLAARAQRVRPGWDDKVLASWNGLMISALAQAYQVLGERRYLDAARRAAHYVLGEMRQPDGRLFATARHGRAHLNAYLDDYAFLIQGLIDLYESDFDERWLREALALDDVLTERFEDPEHGGYFTTGTGHEELLLRVKNPFDGALPAGNGVQALNLLRLAELTGDAERAKRAERTLRSVAALVNGHPIALSQTLLAFDVLHAGAREIVIAGEPGSAPVEALLSAVRGKFLPWRVVALAHAGADVELVPLLAGRTHAPGAARAYVCRNWTCKAPVDGVAELVAQLAE